MYLMCALVTVAKQEDEGNEDYVSSWDQQKKAKNYFDINIFEQLLLLECTFVLCNSDTNQDHAD